MASYDCFLSFEWARGLLPTQLLRVSLAALPTPPRVWFALEQDASLPSSMATGVASSSAFVFIATDGALRKPNVRHEVACAVAAGVRLLLLHDNDGPPPDVLLAQGSEPLSAAAAATVASTPGLVNLTPAAAAAFAAAALAAPRFAFRRDASLAEVVAPALLAALGPPLDAATCTAPPPFRMRALRPAVGACDALFVAAPQGHMQALLLAALARGACASRALSCEVLRADAGEADAAAAVARAGAVVFVLTAGCWECAGFSAAAGEALRLRVDLVLVHEADTTFSGVPAFDDVMKATPVPLKPVFSVNGLAVELGRGAAKEALMLRGLLLKLHAAVAAPCGLPPPPLPASYKAEPTAVPREAARAALLRELRPAAVAVGGLGGAGKTTIAAALADDAAVRAAFDDVAWVTLGKAGQSEIVGALGALLAELEPPGSAPPAALDPIASAVQRLRVVCARRSVLLVVDDVWAPEGWAPDAAALFLSAVDVAPEGGGRASAALFTTRGSRDDPVLAGLSAHAERGCEVVEMGQLAHGVAAAYLADAAKLRDVRDARGLGALLEVGGTLPLGLTLSASCVRAEVEQGASEEEAVEAVVGLLRGAVRGGVTGPPMPGAWLDSAAFCAELASANPLWADGAYGATYTALQVALTAVVAKRDWLKFAAFGLLPDDAYAPEGVLGATWGTDARDTRALLNSLQDAGLVKWEPQAGRAVLHDLAHDFARAMAVTGRGGAAAGHGALLARCGAALLEEGALAAGEWWRVKESVEAGAAAYLGARVGAHLRAAGRGSEGTALVWRFPWLLQGMARQGGAAVTREVGEQMAWERTQGAERAAEAGALKLLHQALVMSAAALDGPEAASGLAAQLLGRLEEGGGARVTALLSEAASWDGGGGAWLRLAASLLPPGGACEGVLGGHTGWVACVCELGGGRIVSACFDKTLRVYDIDSGYLLRVLEGHTEWVFGVCALDDLRVVSASWDKTLRVWDAGSGSVLQVLAGHTAAVRNVCALGDGRVVSGSDDKTLRVWDTRTNGAMLRVLEGHGKGVFHVCALTRGRVVSASYDNTLRVWDVDSGSVLRVLEGHLELVRCVTALGEDRCVSASEDGTLRVWDVNSGDLLQVLEGHTDKAHGVCVLGDGRVASGSADATLRLWDIESGLSRQFGGHVESVEFVCALRDGRVVSASRDATLRIWNPDREMRLGTSGQHALSIRVVCPLDGGRVATGSDDKTLRVWSVATAACLHTLVGHTEIVLCACSVGVGHIVSGSGDCTLRLWDTETGLCLRVMDGHQGWVRQVRFLGAGRVESGSCDGRARLVWDLATGMNTMGLETSPELGTVGIIEGTWNAARSPIACTRLLQNGERVFITETRGQVKMVTERREGRYFAGCLADFSVDNWDTYIAAPVGAYVLTLVPPADDPVAAARGRTAAHFAPWGAPAVHLGSTVTACALLTLPCGQRRVAVAGCVDGSVHFVELVEGDGRVSKRHKP